MAAYLPNNNVILKNRDLLEGKTLGKTFTGAAAVGLITLLSLGVNTPDALLTWSACLAAPLSLFGIQPLRDRVYFRKVERLLGVEKNYPMEISGTHYVERRGDDLIELSSPEEALGSEVYSITAVSLSKVEIQPDPMALWDNSLDSVESVYGLTKATRRGTLELHAV